MIQLKITLDNINYFTLDVDNTQSFPITTAVSDVRSIGSRTGTYSKSITLSDTPNNNFILNHLYQFDSDIPALVYKRVYAQVLENGVVKADNLFFIIDSTTEIDNKRTVQCKLVDVIGGLFAQADNLTCRDLDFSPLVHKYNSINISNSFTNTYEDGYIYHLPYNFANNEYYLTKDFYPGLFVKHIFDLIHEAQGYSYVFHGENNNDIRFEDLVIPFSGDLAKMLEDDLIAYKSIVNPTPSPITLSIPSTDLTTKQAVKEFTSMNEIQDPFNLWQSALFSIDVGLLAPQKMTWSLNGDLTYSVTNNSATEWMANDYGIGVVTANSFTLYARVMNVTTGQVVAQKPFVPTTITQVNGENALNYEDDRLKLLTGIYVDHGQTFVLGTSTNELNLELEWTDTIPNHEYRFEIWSQYRIDDASTVWGLGNWGSPAPVTLDATLANLTVSTTVTTDSLMVDQDIPMNKFAPSVKQNDFLRSIMQIYNLYILPDEEDPMLLHYYTRDEFYDMGHDWGDLTYRLAEDKEIKQQILPELLNRSVLLTYKQDTKDPTLTNYTGTTAEIVAQNRVMFSNENVKGEHKIEPVFSPTVNLMTSFNASVPYLPYIPNVNTRLLLANDMEDCDAYSIADSASGINQIWLAQYRFTAMYDHPLTPNFSIEFGPCDYYTTNLIPTTNNLYNHYRRQMQNINKSKLTTVYMYIDDIYTKLKINDTFILRGVRYYINKIVDWNPSQNTYTKLELITADEVRDVFSHTSPVIDRPTDTGVILPGSGTVKPNKGSNGIFTDIFQHTLDNNVVLPGTGVVISDSKGQILDQSKFEKFTAVKLKTDNINGIPAKIALNKVEKITRDNLNAGNIQLEPNTLYDFSDGTFLQTNSIGNVTTTSELIINTLAEQMYYLYDIYNPENTYTIDDIVIYGQRVWKNLTGITDEIISLTELDSANWDDVTDELDLNGDRVYLYEDKALTAYYNKGIIVAVKDNRNNLVHGMPFITIDSMSTLNKYLLIDWNSPTWSNNRCTFFANNTMNDFRNNDCEVVFCNKAEEIYNVKCTHIKYNYLNGNIYNVISSDEVSRNRSVTVNGNHIYNVICTLGIKGNSFSTNDVCIYYIHINGIVGDELAWITRTSDVTQTITYL